jgi:hypothetical protein
VRTVSVYHVKDQEVPGGRSLLGQIGDGIVPINFPANHELVANVQTDKPGMEAYEEAYMLTQNMEEPWIENIRVDFTKDTDGCRSTHIGDVLVLDGRPYVCAHIGFEVIVSQDQKVWRR